MTSIEILWENLAAAKDRGGAQRVDASHPCDLYAALDLDGRPGLLLITDRRPPRTLAFETVDVTVAERADAKWSLGVWLRDPALSGPFAGLCGDISNALRGVDAAGAAAYLLAYLLRWRRLLAPGSDLLSEEALRGLLGEIVVLEDCLDLWAPEDLLRGWTGPMGGHQDIVLPSLRIEVKTARPGAALVRISSLDQLDVTDTRLLLGVVTLGSGSPDDGSTAATMIQHLRDRLLVLNAHGALFEYENRLAAAGWGDAPGYGQTWFRLESVHYYEVGTGFPKVTRADVPGGVSEASYDIRLGICAAFALALDS